MGSFSSTRAKLAHVNRAQTKRMRRQVNRTQTGGIFRPSCLCRDFVGLSARARGHRSAHTRRFEKVELQRLFVVVALFSLALWNPAFSSGYDFTRDPVAQLHTFQRQELASKGCVDLEKPFRTRFHIHSFISPTQSEQDPVTTLTSSSIEHSASLIYIAHHDVVHEPSAVLEHSEAIKNFTLV